jgi:hypothetical protein
MLQHKELWTFALLALLLGSVASADDTFESALADARAYRIRVDDPARWQEKVNRFASILARYAAHPQIYEAELEIIALLIGDSSTDSLDKADLLLRDLLRRVRLEEAAGQKIRLKFLEFQIGFCAGTARQDLLFALRVADELFAYASDREDRTLRLMAAAYRSRALFAQGNPVDALRIAVDELVSAAKWASHGGLEAVLKDGNDRYHAFLDAYEQLETVAANVLDGCSEQACLDVAQQKPKFIANRTFLDNAIDRWRPPAQVRVPATLTPSRWRLVLILANAALVLGLLTAYISRLFRHRKTELCVAAIGLSLLTMFPATAAPRQGNQQVGAPISIPIGSNSNTAVPPTNDQRHNTGVTSASSTTQLFRSSPSSPANRVVSLAIESDRRVFDLDLGSIDAVRPYIVDLELVNRLDRTVEIVELLPDCNCITIHSARQEAISPGSSFVARLEFTNEIMGPTNREILLKSTAGEFRIALKAMASRGVYFQPPLELHSDDKGFEILVGTYHLISPGAANALDLAGIDFDSRFLELIEQHPREKKQQAVFGDDVTYLVSERAFRFQPAAQAPVGWHDVPINIRITESESSALVLEKSLHPLLHVSRGFEVRPAALTSGFVDLRSDKLPIVRTATVQVPEGYSLASAQLKDAPAGLTLSTDRKNTAAPTLKISFTAGAPINRPIHATVVAVFVQSSGNSRQVVNIPVRGFLLDRSVQANR